MTEPHIHDLSNATPGDPPPVRIGTAWCSSTDGMPRAIPVYAEWPGGTPVEGGVVTDLEEGWTIDRIELDAPVPEPELTPEQTDIQSLKAAVDTLILDRLGSF